MTMSSIGDRARSYTLANQTSRLKAELERRSSEATTGRSGDIGQSLRGDFTSLTALDTTIARLAAFRTATSETALAATAMQSALSTISDLSGELGSMLISVSSPSSPVSADTAGTDALSRFRTVVGALNTRIGDRTLFSGNQTRGPALASSEEMLDAMMAAVSSATTADEVETALDNWFADPAGYDAQAYVGGPALKPLKIAADESVVLDVTAADPAIRDTLKGLAMAALLARGMLPDQPEQRSQLASRAGTVLVEGATSRSVLAARIGTVEGRVASAETRNFAEATALAIARTGIVAVDPYEAATALTNAETQLDTLYAITSRLSRLTLASYL